MQRGNRTVNALYPATSDEGLHDVCAKLAAAFDLPAFTLSHQSENLETATASSAGMTIAVTRFSGSIDAEEASLIGPPDYWNLAWRAAVGLEFNYQVAGQNKRDSSELFPLHRRLDRMARRHSGWCGAPHASACWSLPIHGQPHRMIEPRSIR
jgi:hypothetical protein